MIRVRVGVDHRPHRPLTPMLGVQREGGRRALPGDERVDHDHARLALHHRHQRDVEPAELVDAGDDLEEAVLDQQLPLPPEARVDGLGWLRPAHERVGVQVPHDPAVLREDLPLLGAGHESPPRILEVPAVLDGQPRDHLLDGAPCGRGHRPALAHVPFLVARPGGIHRSYSLKSGREDLNLRPPGPQPGALPGCATPRETTAYRIIPGSRRRPGAGSAPPRSPRPSG